MNSKTAKQIKRVAEKYARQKGQDPHLTYKFLKKIYEESSPETQMSILRRA